MVCRWRLLGLGFAVGLVVLAAELDGFVEKKPHFVSEGKTFFVFISYFLTYSFSLSNLCFQTFLAGTREDFLGNPNSKMTNS